MTRPIDVGEIAGMLAARAPALCRELFPNGKREGHEFRVGSLAGEKGRSMAVNLGRRPGVWSDFASGESGDALDLVSMALFGGDKGRAIQWAKTWLGLDDGEGARPVPKRPPAPEKDPGVEPSNRAPAFGLWLGAEERISGTPVETYLAGRGIDLKKLGRDPGALRYHPALSNKESGRKWPAMVAAIHGRDGKIIACHRTFLEIQPDGSVTKAPLKDPKMTLGSYRGGAIRLWRGFDDEPLARARPGETIVLAEGIEDGLTIIIATPDYRVLAAVSLGNLGSVELPEQVETVIIAADNDGDNPAAAKALKRAIRNFQDQGRTVRIARAPLGYKDFNELLQKGV